MAKHHDVVLDRRSAIRYALHLSVIFLTFFLLIRTVGCEPFGVPTGSMAPALLGNHREVPCPRCGHPVIIGESPQERRSTYTNATCPNCGQKKIDLTSAPDIQGDRLMVDKNVYSLRKPKRWEVAMFHCPVERGIPYVKRVIGLPGEHIQLGNGDVYANGEMVRKTPEQFLELAIPIFNMNYAPPGGWAVRFVKDAWETGAKLPRIGPAPIGTVATDKDVLDNTLVFKAQATPQTLASYSYRHFNLDTKAEDPIKDTLQYNAGLGSGGGSQPVHDFAVAFDLNVTAGAGLFLVRLNDGKDVVTMTMAVNTEGGATLLADGITPAGDARFKLNSVKTNRIMMGMVDRRAWLLVNGKVAMPYLDLPADRSSMLQRSMVTRPVQLAAQGLEAIVSNLQILRDVHYRADGPQAYDSPLTLGPTEYFMLGDNSGNSKDSRSWQIPGVPERDFIGKPFLIHQPLRAGRVTMNGEEKQYQTVDWSRLRWVR